MKGEEGKRYSIKMAASAVKEYKRLPLPIKERITKAIDELAVEPRGRNVEKIRNNKERYRARVGNYRIIFDLLQAELIIDIIRIRSRGRAYK